MHFPIISSLTSKISLERRLSTFCDFWISKIPVKTEVSLEVRSRYLGHVSHGNRVA